MEKDNKYYGIIENLVKTHRKYNGYDVILDDIIDDVFRHAKSVIESVKDEEVVLSYLQKLVSVSIITVPRKMNFHSEIKHRSISQTPLPEIQPVKDFSPVTEVQPIEVIQPATETEENTAVQEPITIEPAEVAQPAIEAEEDTTIQESITIEPTDNISDSVIEYSEPKANVEFVDKMINSIDSASIMNTQPSEVIETEFTEDDLTLDVQAEDNVIIEPAEQEDEDTDISDGVEEHTVESDDDNIDLSDNEEEPVELDSDDTNLSDNADEFVELDSEDTVLSDNADELFEPDKEPVDEIESIEFEPKADIEEADIETETLIEEAGNDISYSTEEEPLLAEENDIEELQTEELTTVGDSIEYLPEEKEIVEIETEDIFAENESNEELTVDESFVIEPQAGDLGDLDTVDLAEEALISEEEAIPQDNIELSEAKNSDEFFDDNTDFVEQDLNSDLDIELNADETLLPSDDIENLNTDMTFLESGSDNTIELVDEYEAVSDDSDFEIGDDNDILLETDETFADNISETEHTEPNYKPVDNSLFNFAPTKKDEEIDIQSIEMKLADLNNKMPGLNILRIFDLKYKQNMPITKIAEELQLDKQAVVSALDKIVELI